MARKPRIHYTETDKVLMWDRWQKGASLEKIAQLFDRTHGSVARILRRTGGIRPPKRTRSRRTLSLAEREEISRGVVAGRSLRSIATSLCRSPSTVSREINRNGGRAHYRANVADQAAWNRAHRPKTCKLVQNRALAGIVANQLQLEWSPRQIAGWLKRTYPDLVDFSIATNRARITPCNEETVFQTKIRDCRNKNEKAAGTTSRRATLFHNTICSEFVTIQFKEQLSNTCFCIPRKPVFPGFFIQGLN